MDHYCNDMMVNSEKTNTANSTQNIEVGCGVASGNDSYAVGRDAASKAISSITSHPLSAVIIFAPASHQLDEMLSGVQTVAGDAPLFCASEAGELCNLTSSGIVMVMALASPFLKVSAGSGKRMPEDSPKAVPQGMETELAEKVCFLQAVLDNIPNPVFYKDPDGKYLGCNKAFEKYLDVRREKIQGKDVQDIRTADLIDLHHKMDAELIQKGGSVIYESMNRPKDGNARHDITHKALFHKADGSLGGIVATVTDITELKHAKDALAESEELYRDLFENASIGMFHSTLDGKFLLANKVFASSLGYESPEELISTITDAATQLYSDPEYRTEMLAAVEQQGWFYTERPFIRKDGSTLFGRLSIRKVVKKDGTVYLDGIAEDITERKQAEEKLKQYAEEITDLYESAPCGYHSSGKDGTILRMNQTELSWLGYSRDEVIGKMKLVDLLPPEEIQRFHQVFPVLMKHGQLLDLDGKFIRRDGSVFHALINVIAIFDENGNYLMDRVSVFDNTERKRAEEALIQSERELRIKAKDLMDTSTTLKVLLNTMEKDQEELKERVLDNIKRQVMPYFDQLKKRPLQEIEKGLIQMAEENLNDIASPFVQKLTSSYLNLTKKEIQIAELVKDGKTSKEIAQILDASQRVIEFHRENIRGKLGLKKKKGSLAMLLRSFS